MHNRIKDTERLSENTSNFINLDYDNTKKTIKTTVEKLNERIFRKSEEKK